MTRAPRIGLVLGGGGVIGNAYLTGVLEGIRRVSGWDPAAARITIGTSAGSVNGAFTAIGVPTELTYRYVTGEQLPEDVYPGTAVRLRERRDDEWTERLYAPTGVLPRPFLSSPHCMLKAVLHPWDTSLEVFVAGLLGEGMMSTRTIGELIEAVQPEGWPERAFWAVAVDLESGARVAFGRDDAPRTDVSRAVRASCAIPAFFAPVRIGGRRYVDGGIWSVSNLDLVAGLGLDLVVCVNPMSSLEGRAYEGPVDRITAAIHEGERRARIRFGRRLGWERRLVEESGTQVLLVQPTAADLEVIPVNPMSSLEGRAYEGPVDRITAAIHEGERRARIRFGRRLGWERRLVEESGTQVLLVQPTAADLEVIPVNLMRASERRAVAQRALETTIAGLETRADWQPALRLLQAGADHAAATAVPAVVAARAVSARDTNDGGRAR